MAAVSAKPFSLKRKNAMVWVLRIMSILLLTIGGSWMGLMAQSRFEITPELDRLIRSGMEDMYRYDLHFAEDKFDLIIRRVPDHPIGYMYRAQVEWWKALRDFTNKSVSSGFDTYNDVAIQKGEALIAKDPNDFYAHLFLASAYGSRTRFAVTISGETWKAIKAAKAGNKYILIARRLRPDYVDCLLGTGSWDYFTGDLPAIVKPFAFMLGIHGDKTRGKEDLKAVTQKGEYARVEARIVLLGVAINEKKFQDWLVQLEELILQYPTNPVLYNWMGSYFSKEKRWDEGIRQFLELQKKLMASNGRNGRESGTAFIHFNLGNLELGRNNLDSAIAYFTQSISARQDDYLLVAPAALLRGNCHKFKNEREAAIDDYRLVLKLPPVDKSHREASSGLRAMKAKEK
jgi:tetratricopeptide (TPR) repeat protein